MPTLKSVKMLLDLTSAVQRPRQILLKVCALGLATEMYIQKAVVLVSAIVAQIMENVQKCVFRASLSRKIKFYQHPYCEICAEAIQMLSADTYSAGVHQNVTEVFYVFDLS